MLRKISKSRFSKVFAVFMAYNLVFQLGFPTVAFALTSGPTQPEAGAFQQVDVSKMVDLFSGDFNYNLPLITVPGPNGGYPINLTYNSNVTMEQEASWVGLGWNVNTGAINRSMRGLPDDFKGDPVIKEKNVKRQRNISLIIPNTPVNSEAFGLDFNKIGGVQYQFYYDNYTGKGMEISGSAATKIAKMTKGRMNGKIGLSYDTKNGLGVEPTLSINGRINKETPFMLSPKVSINSKQGLKDVTLKSSFAHYNEDGSSWGSKQSMSFASASYVPGNEMPTAGWSATIDAKIGGEVFGVTGDIDLAGNYTENGIIDRKVTRDAYGFLYSDQSSESRDLLDFNREKNAPVNKHTPSLPVPISTPDVFTIKGQGIGGSFRPYRSEVALYHDPTVRGATVGVGGGLEADFGATPEYKASVNPNLQLSNTYSGMWRSNHSAVTDNYSFQAGSNNSPYEPVYFKVAGELTESNYTSDAAYSDKPFNVDVSETYTGAFFKGKARPYIEEKNGSRQQIASARRTDRDTRDQHVSFLTREELHNMNRTIVSEDRATTTEDYATTITHHSSELYSSGQQDYSVGHHIGEFTVLKQDGQRYKFGLPLYNFIQKDVAFALSEGTSNDIQAKQVSYSHTGGDDSKSNKNGDNHLFSATTIPPYAHSYMLTEILSADYVDMDDTLGPSDGDMGFWVKFNYEKKYSASSPYKWRVPFQKDTVNISHGNLSNPRDNVGSYSYGEKEIAYVKSVETKTHVARFYVHQRTDALGTSGTTGGKSTSAKLFKLDSIKLYNKQDTNYCIKAAHFVYESTAANQLCRYAPNNTTSSNGKLTLQRVYFTYGSNRRGELSPYVFSYHSYNPSYNALASDRWGYLQLDDPDAAPFMSNLDYPYVNQKDSAVGSGALSDNDRSNIASAWRLTQIELPTGGKIKINYEMDDYAYVQNKKALQMCKIVNTGQDNTTSPTNTLHRKDTRVYFELESPIPTTGSPKDELAKYLENLDKIYFKTYVKLKKEPSNYGNNGTEVSGDGYVYDYVEGYAEPDIDLTTQDGFGFDVNRLTGGSEYKYAYVRIKPVELKDKGLGPKVHPFRKAAIQYLKMERPDLFMAPNTAMGQISGVMSLKAPLMAVVKMLSSVSELFVGWYNTALIKGYAKELNLDGTNYKPSFIRLNSPDGIKYGGGSRVAKITVDDSWGTISTLTDASDYEYGQEYTYRMPDGTSSGVAAYEPMVGGEENPWKEQVRYSSDRFLFKDKSLMVEEPFNESLFPGANVGYQRVVVKSLDRTDSNSQPVTKSATGYQVHEFYTAKEFPVKSNRTDVKHKNYKLHVCVPFIGVIAHQSDVYSQGYSIELNDMHGKKKSEAVYAYNSSAYDQPISRTEYYYKTQTAYNPNDDNYLDNTVDVMTADGITSTAEIGKTIDVFADMRENYSHAWNQALDPNLMVIWVAAIPVIVPATDVTKSMFRSVVTNKIIKRCGILEKVRHIQDGSVLETNNLYYDPVNGSVVLSTVQNNFEAPVYDYKYPAHWNYDGMSSAYQDQGMVISDTNTLKAYCQPGTKLMDVSNGDRYWVASVSPALSLVDTADNAASFPGTVKVLRSGYRNQQGIAVGSIESLSNPLDSKYFPMFSNPHYSSGLNTYIDGHDLTEGTPFSFTSYDCNGDTIIFEASHFATTMDSVIFESINGKERQTGCNIYLVFDDATFYNGTSYDSVKLSIDSVNFALLPGGSQVFAWDGSKSATGTITIDGSCQFNECLDGVLNAMAVKFKDQWSYDYEDADADKTTTQVNANKYRYGKYGVWRQSEMYVYDADRKQTSAETRTGADGTFSQFTLFDWNNDNDVWTRKNKITQWSPYGFELENQNIISVKSAALYGYSNSLATAVGKNTPYFELVFDGFEDYGSSGYPTSSGHGHGHILFAGGTTPTASTTEAHTGERSLKVPDSTYYNITVGSVTDPYFDPQASSDYYFSCWVKTDESAEVFIISSTDTTMLATSNSDVILDGWRRLEGKFTTGASSTNLKIVLRNTGSTADPYFDDLRIQPFVSTMTSFVYDPNTHWLKAQLDDRNYATFYNYDEQGQLVQVKKETSKGVVTLKMDRKVTRDNPNF